MNAAQELTQLIQKTLLDSFGPNILGPTPEVNLTPPKDKKFGDFSTNLALVLAQKQADQPLKIAALLRANLEKELTRSSLKKQIAKIEVQGPGFINFYLNPSYLYKILLEIGKQKYKFGSSPRSAGKKIHIEFASANPTGPLNVAHARQAAFGDSLANLLEFLGNKVTREYYLNDEGLQIELLGESVSAKYLQFCAIPTQFPASGYQGKYISDLAQKLFRRYGRKLASPEKKAFFSEFAYRNILKEIKQDLKSFGVNFDSWFSQRSLSESGKIKKALGLLRKKGFIYQKDGAWWLASTKFGDDKDRVVIKSDAKLTYITADIAYHQTKFKRGFSQMLNVWGPDHHGYIGRIKAAISALGYDAEQLKVLIVQLVSLSQAEKIIPMSTRMGQYVSLADIIKAVGKDAARFFFLMRKKDAHLNFDLALAKKQSLENPVYYIQYAHARIANILKFAQKDKNIKLNSPRNLELSLLDKPEELSLIQILREFPTVVASCGQGLEPHRMTVYLQDLAKTFHNYYEKYRVVCDNPALTQARVVLIAAVKIVLKNALGLLAIRAPESM
ncbi:MAG: arginine--tRNA ligase [Candidatus Omnitrophica bacterium]|nr:arginine--tRNA ligase [Candidatus Omnitrophota bacterium]